MRIAPLLDALTSRIKQKLLAATLLRSEKEWYLLELARHLHLVPSSIQRELAGLVQAGILRRREDGNRVYFQADSACPVFDELRSMLLKTVGLVDVLRECLAPLAAKIEVAFVYGSIAASHEQSSSDVDLMIVGAAGLAEISAAIRKVELQIGRNINPTVYTSGEFSRKATRRSHFLTAVLGKELLFVHGTKVDLERIAPHAADKAPQDQPRGTARPARRRRAGPEGRRHRRALD